MLLQAGAIAPGGKLTLNDQVAGGLVQLIAGTGGIALNSGILASTVDLNTTGGGVTQAMTAAITATSVISSLGVTGDVSLSGAANFVNGVGPFTVTAAAPGAGNFQMRDGSELTVSGQLAAPAGNVYLEDSNAGGIVVDPHSAVNTGATGMASFQTNSFMLAAGAVQHRRIGVDRHVRAGTGYVRLSRDPGPRRSPGVVVPGLANITATQVRIGAVTQPGSVAPVTTAGTITIGGTFDANNMALELDVNGAIDGSVAPLINVATLSGTSTGEWNLPLNNSVTVLGNIAANGFGLNDTIPLTVAGAVNGGAVVTIADVGLLQIQGNVSPPRSFWRRTTSPSRAWSPATLRSA